MKAIRTSPYWTLSLTLSGTGRFLVRAPQTGGSTTAPNAPASFKIFSSAKDALLRRSVKAQRMSKASSATSLGAFRSGTTTVFYHTANAQNPLVWQQQPNTVVGAAFTAGNHQASPARPQVSTAPAESGANHETTGDAGKQATEGPTTYTTNSNHFTGHRLDEMSTTDRKNQFGGYRGGLYSTTDARNQFSNFQGRTHNSTAPNDQFDHFESGQSNTVAPNHRFNDCSSGGAKPKSHGNSSDGFAGGCYNTTGTGNQFTGYLSGSSTTTGTYNTALGNTSPNSAAARRD